MVIATYDLRATDSELSEIAAGRIKCKTCKDMFFVIGIDGKLKVCPTCREVIHLGNF